jgi:hypothetical protein
MLNPTDAFIVNAAAQQRFSATWTNLWKVGFAVRVWLYDSSQAECRSFLEEVLSEKPDGIVWLMPHCRVTLLGQRLLDCGVRVVRLAATLSYMQMLQDIVDTFG